MKFPAAAFPLSVPTVSVRTCPVWVALASPLTRSLRRGAFRWGAIRFGTLAACAAALAGCASQTVQAPGRPAGGGRYFDPVLGVWASPRVVDDGEAVPRGGGGFLVGRPYTIGGHLYVPNADPRGYSATGTASWYGDAFHGRRTANGEIFDKGSISAAHPTLPLPSYVRVTNLNNGRSMIVRVNDRGPYHGGRVMDVSQRVADALAFRNEGTGHVRIDYVGRAGLSGDDDERLLATLTTDGRPARLDGLAEPVEVAGGDPLPPRPAGPSPLPNFPARVASLPIFRRGHAAAGLPSAPAPVEPLATPVFPPPRAAEASRGLSAPASATPGLGWRLDRAAPIRRGAPVRDPFYKPLVPPPKPEAAPRASIGFGGAARRGDGLTPSRSVPTTARKAPFPRRRLDGEDGSR